MSNKKNATFFLIVVAILIIITLVIYTRDNTRSADQNKLDDDNIELVGIVTHIVDGDTLDIGDNRIRLSLVDTPERGQKGYIEAKKLVQNICLNKKGQVDIDDGQRRGDRYGRDIGVVYCNGININKELIDKNLAKIYLRFCDISEFSNEDWAKPKCH
jgi:micrococcal nuclease